MALLQQLIRQLLSLTLVVCALQHLQSAPGRGLKQTAMGIAKFAVQGSDILAALLAHPQERGLPFLSPSIQLTGGQVLALDIL